MKEKIPQYIILDLLPLYLADEVSKETSELIEEYLKTDHQLAKLAEQAKNAPSLQEIPAPLNKETEMKAYKKGKYLMIQHNVFLALAVFLTLVVGHSFVYSWENGRGVIMALTIVCWYAFISVNEKIEG